LKRTGAVSTRNVIGAGKGTDPQKVFEREREIVCVCVCVLLRTNTKMYSTYSKHALQ